MENKKPHLETFASEYHMLKFFGQYLTKLDVNKSVRLSQFLYVYDEKLILSRNLFEFLSQMEDLTGLGINVRASVQKNRAFLVFFDNKPKSASEFVINSNTAAIDKATIKSLEKETPVSVPVVTTDIVSEIVQEPEKVVNVNEELFKRAAELKDDTKKAASKLALEKLATEHGVSLSRAKTFDAMLEDFKLALM